MRKAVRAIVIKDNQLLVIKRNKFGKEYYTLPGGGIDPGETAEQALLRELREETNVTVDGLRPVFVEEAGNPFGTQYIFLCDYIDGEPVLSPDSEEAKIHALGFNLYTPEWLPLSHLTKVQFMSPKLRDAIVRSLLEGFPLQVQPVA